MTAPLAAPNRPLILYIEDEPMSRRLVSKVLAAEFEVITASGGLEGVQLAQRRRPDLVLTDLNMPEFPGEYVTARLQTLYDAPLRVVAVTAQAGTGFHKRALAAGCVGFILKPIDVTTFPDTVRAYLSGSKIEKLSPTEELPAVREMMVEMAEKLEKVTRRVQEDHAELRTLERAKSAFLTQVAHELRTPLTALSGYVQMLGHRLREIEAVTAHHPDLIQLSDQSEDGMKRLHRLMNEIVVMARLSANQLDAEKSLIRPGQLAQETIAEFSQAVTERRLTVTAAGDGLDTPIMGDTTLVRMLFANLISNALKFTPDGGSITVRLENYPDVIHITVQDTGVGISADNLPLLFKPFYSAIDVSRGRTSKTDFMGMGMGLGLTIISRIVEAHRGKVWAESAGYDEEKLPGSTFHVLLPTGL